MCIVADSVDSVSNTKIAAFHVGVRPNKNAELKPKQLIVYSADVNSLTNSNAFILPVYNPTNNTNLIIPLDMSKMSNFFDEIDEIFEKWFPSDLRRSLETNGTYGIEFDSATLPVFRVGDYKFSLMPNKLDFSRLNKLEFNLNPAAKVAIDMHNLKYSFIVAQFEQRGQAHLSPFAYLADPPTDDSILVPTIHGHPHGNGSFQSFDSGSSDYAMFGILNQNQSDFEQSSSFDHIIYAIVKNPVDTIATDKDKSYLRSILRKIQTDYNGNSTQIYIPTKFKPYKLKLNGNKPNRNILFMPDSANFAYDLLSDIRN